MRTFTLEEIRNSAMRLDANVEEGNYVIRGPRENLMEFEARLAWASVAGKLHHEGYIMVSLREYAATYGITIEAALDRIEKDGSLFALLYTQHEEDLFLVPLEEREERPPMG